MKVFGLLILLVALYHAYKAFTTPWSMHVNPEEKTTAEYLKESEEVAVLMTGGAYASIAVVFLVPAVIFLTAG